ncbi:hypothetical protein NC99_40240 [Sunxiuqinia dokdonensis]|uniref:Uncharacterized protein n=1 Tax=Sunxiuqinia dokdonensis TaxID=1409788 RepID=A0A0L8V3U7_9BACT|nr:hypothetical protein NC99_40240 [Sunxiuqinia dokdonensis]
MSIAVLFVWTKIGIILRICTGAPFWKRWSKKIIKKDRHGASLFLKEEFDSILNFSTRRFI